MRKSLYKVRQWNLVWQIIWSPCGVEANVLDCNIIVRKFKLQSLFYVHFKDKYPWERHELPYPYQLWVKMYDDCTSTRMAMVLNKEIKLQGICSKTSNRCPKLWIEPNPICSVVSLPSRLGRGCRIHQLHLCRGLRPPPNECPGYDTKQSDGEVLVMLELWGMRSTPSLPLLSGPLWPGLVAPDKGPIYGLNRTNSMLNWIVWLNWIA